jgi:hypothetical protein
MSGFGQSDGVEYELKSNNSAHVSSVKEPQETLIIPKSVIIGNSTYTVTDLGTMAFFQDSNLKHLSFVPDSEVTTFDQCAFQNSALASLCFPPKLSQIHPDIFRHTPDLVSITSNSPSFVVDSGLVSTYRPIWKSFRFGRTCPFNMGHRNLSQLIAK